jgi:hypothetical protein
MRNMAQNNNTFMKSQSSGSSQYESYQKNAFLSSANLDDLYFVGDSSTGHNTITLEHDIIRKFAYSNALKHLIGIYENECHYSERDLLNIGQELGLGLLAFSNMDSMQYSSSVLMQIRQKNESKMSIQQKKNAENANSQEDFSSFNFSAAKKSQLNDLNVSYSETNERKNLMRLLESELDIPSASARQNDFRTLTSFDQLSQPLLHASVIPEEILLGLMSNKYGNNVCSAALKCIRIQAEIDVRNKISKNKISTLQLSNTMEYLLPQIDFAENAKCDEGEDDVSSAGSDSDPSGDELPPSQVFNSPSFMHLARFSNSLSTNIKKYLRKNRKKKKMSKKSKSTTSLSTGSTTPSKQPDEQLVTEKKTFATSKRVFSAPHRKAIAESVKLQNSINIGELKMESVQQVSSKSTVRIKNFTIAETFGQMTRSNSGAFRDFNTRRSASKSSPSKFPENETPLRKSSSSKNFTTPRLPRQLSSGDIGLPRAQGFAISSFNDTNSQACSNSLKIPVLRSSASEPPTKSFKRFLFNT